MKTYERPKKKQNGNEPEIERDESTHTRGVRDYPNRSDDYDDGSFDEIEQDSLGQRRDPEESNYNEVGRTSDRSFNTYEKY